GTLTVGALLRDPRDRAEALPVIALALARDGALQLLPDDDVAVRPGDQLLMCGRGRGRRAQRLLLADGAVLAYVLGGRRTSGSFVWRRRERAVQRA
ncbi:MAG: hypothetical protein MUF30_02270, partial [Burkholderiales bacterium]|nr:hypothetical protein [Burkholderiales bacterium]